MEYINIKLLDTNTQLPTRNHDSDAGLDLYSVESILLPHARSATIRLGVAIELPEGYYGQLCGRSGLGKQGIFVIAGVMDSGYRGEYHVTLCNLSGEDYQINVGDRIAQLVIISIVTPKVIEVNSLTESSRGALAFASSGR